MARTGPYGTCWVMWRVLGHIARIGPCGTYWVMLHVWDMWHVLGHVARIPDGINVYGVLVEKFKERDKLEDLGSQEQIRLRWVLEK